MGCEWRAGVLCGPLGRSAVLLLLQPAAVVEQAREAAMRALTRAGARTEAVQ